MIEYRMPSLGADMKDARVVEWFVQPGDAVQRGSVVGVVDTAKGAIEMEIWVEGTVTEIVVPPGAKVPVGEVLLRLSSPDTAGPGLPRVRAPETGALPPSTPVRGSSASVGAPAGADGPRLPHAAAPPPEAGPVPPATSATGETGGRGGRGSPAARRLAAQRGIDLTDVEGSGPGGAVRIADVERFLAQGSPPPRVAAARRAAPPRPPWWTHATPVARNAAEALGIDLHGVAGSGPGGLITREDVEAVAAEIGIDVGPDEAAPPAPGHPGAGPMDGHGAAERAGQEAEGIVESPLDPRQAMRAAIAAAMARSKREIPHYYLATCASFAPALSWLERTNTTRPPERRILPVTLLIRATALAAHAFPEMNGAWMDGAFHPSPAVHPGLVIALRGGGVVAPALRDADRRDLEDLSTAVTDLVQRARAGRLRSSEMTEATITVSSLGERGVETVFGVIYPPQVALVGFGRVTERPWVEDGSLQVRPALDVTLAADHRVSDGHRGGLFLERIAELLQQPETL